MLNFLSNSFKYTAVGCLAVLALGLAGCEQQQVEPTAATPKMTPANPDYYFVNSQISTRLLVESLEPKKIARVDVLRGPQAIAYTHNADAQSVVLVQTN